jgi:hypothetical protein
MKTLSYLFLLSFFIICSCKTTVNKPLAAEFNDLGKFQDEFSTLVVAEGINLEGSAIEADDKTSTEINLTITNGKDLPTDPEAQKSVGRTLAATVKKHLKNKEQFEIYKVRFQQHLEDPSKVNWIQNIFKSTELTVSE